MKTFILLFASTMLLISCGGKTETEKLMDALEDFDYDEYTNEVMDDWDAYDNAMEDYGEIMEDYGEIMDDARDIYEDAFDDAMDMLDDYDYGDYNYDYY